MIPTPKHEHSSKAADSSAGRRQLRYGFSISHRAACIVPRIERCLCPCWHLSQEVRLKKMILACDGARSPQGRFTAVVPDETTTYHGRSFRCCLLQQRVVLVAHMLLLNSLASVYCEYTTLHRISATMIAVHCTAVHSARTFSVAVRTLYPSAVPWYVRTGDDKGSTCTMTGGRVAVKARVQTRISTYCSCCTTRCFFKHEGVTASSMARSGSCVTLAIPNLPSQPLDGVLCARRSHCCVHVSWR